VYLANDTLGTDTIKIKSLPRKEFVEKAVLGLQKEHEGVKKINKQDGIQLVFNRPIAKVNNELLGLYADSTQTLVKGSLEVDSTQFKVDIMHDWNFGLAYEMVLLPGAVTDIYGLKNDTISLSYAVHGEEELGEISAEVTDLDSTEVYIITLSKSNKEIKRYTVEGKNSFDFALKYLEAGDYTVEVVLDSNKNGRWDTGNYEEKKYPEKKYAQKLEKLRANWTVDVRVTPQF